MRPLSLVALSGCALGAAEPGSDTTDDLSTSLACGTATIGPAGGSLSYGRTEVSFPAGAIAVDTDLSLCFADPPAGYTAVSDVLDAQPADLELLIPSTATIVYDEGAADPAAYGPDGAGTSARLLRTTDDGTVLTSTIYRLGTLFAATDPRGVDEGGLNPAADVLFVVDNSCSMADEQQQVSGDVVTALDALAGSGLDYHVGVTSTDLDGSYNGADGTLRTVGGVQWIDSATADPRDTFAAMVQMGTTGSGNEKPVGAAYSALELKAQTANLGFHRDGAQVAVVIVSDEPDFTPRNLVTVPEWIDWFDAYAEPHEGSVYAVVDPLFPPYDDIVAAVGGESFDVHAPSYGPVLSRAVAALQSPVVPLTEVPDAATIEVWVLLLDGSEPALLDPASWTYDAALNEVVVDEGALAPGDEVTVVYTVL